jgi:hypothetical protein
MGDLNELLDGDRPTPMIVTDDGTQYKNYSLRLALNMAVSIRDRAPLLPIGSRRNPLLFLSSTARNADTKIKQLTFSGRALDRMQQCGLMPSVVLRAIRHGERLDGVLGFPTRFDRQNGTLVLLDTRRKTVVTVGHTVHDSDGARTEPQRIAAVIAAYQSTALSLLDLTDYLGVAVPGLVSSAKREELNAHWWRIEQAYAVSEHVEGSSNGALSTIDDTLREMADTLAAPELLPRRAAQVEAPSAEHESEGR